MQLCVEGKRSPEDFYDWLTDYSFAVLADPGNPLAQMVADLLLVLSEYLAGHRKSASLKKRFAELLPVEYAISSANTSVYAFAGNLSDVVQQLGRYPRIVAYRQAREEGERNAFHSDAPRSNASPRFLVAVCSQ